MEFIDLKAQQLRIREKIEKNVLTIFDHGQYIMGPEIYNLEEQLASYTGAKYCVSNSSGTDALLLAMLAIDIKPGDEIITTPFTFFATGEMIALIGAKLVFVDIDENTYNIDPQKIEAAITEKTKAIIPVSLYGLCADMNAINQIAEKYNITVIEDAAQSFGATYHGKKSCNISKIGCTSFFPSKPLGGYGDSGACFTSDEEIASKMKELRIHGQKSRYNHTHYGINGRMDTIQAAILLAKLEIFEEETNLRNRIGDRYKKLINGKIKTQYTPEGYSNIYAQFTVEIENRSEVQNRLNVLKIPTAVHYPIPMHLQIACKHLGYKLGDFPNSEQAAKRVMSLPMHPYLTTEEQDQIVDALLRTISSQ